jgi:hypothetical protein
VAGPFDDLPPGDTFELLVEGFYPHLWIACTEPDANGNVLIVSLNSEQKYYDGACPVGKGEHSHVYKDGSYIRYGGRFMLEPDVWRMIKEKGYGKRAPLSSALFRRVLEKGLDSIYLTAVEKALIKRQIGTLPS